LTGDISRTRLLRGLSILGFKWPAEEENWSDKARNYKKKNDHHHLEIIGPRMMLLVVIHLIE
jgi:hypothetical protein